VFVRDTTGTHRDEYFFTTDPGLTPTAVIGHYCGRWNIETRSKKPARRSDWRPRAGGAEHGPARRPVPAGPVLGVAILFHALPESKRTGPWGGRQGDRTFSDALCAIRRWLWAEARFTTGRRRHGSR